MKATKIQTRAGQFKILVAVKGPRTATAHQLRHALNIAVNRIARSERRQALLRDRRRTSAPQKQARRRRS